uniref:DNA mismatch repair proteins mutS family domain-containing protein n=1 Tax=Spongospora subterranea TaxID=70186 RepID=A0A0H5QRF6_9EUKA|eukprot:CRZ04086.1 hypothetical protein [Spongospora subterranea]
MDSTFSPRSEQRSTIRGGLATLSSLSSGPTHAGTHNIDCGPARCQASVEHDADSVSDMSSIYLSVFLSGSPENQKVGIAYFNVDTDMLHVGDFLDVGRLLESLKFRLSPIMIITHARVGDPVFELLQQGPEGQRELLYNVVSVKRSEFNYDSALNRLKLITVSELESKPLGDEPSKTGEPDELAQRLRLMSVINLENRDTICAVGGLLSYLQKNRITNQLSDYTHPVTIAAIRTMDMGDVMIVDSGTLRALSIFNNEMHPVGSSSRKEGLSVFGLLDETKTVQGKRLLKSWLLTPIMDIDEVSKRHDAIERLLDQKNEHWLAEAVFILRGVKDITRLMVKLENARAKCSDWFLIIETIQQFISLHELARNADNRFGHFNLVVRAFFYSTYSLVPNQIVEAWDDEIIELNNLITSVIDFSESKISKRLEIRNGISTELDEIKRNYEELGSFLTNVAEEIVSNSSVHFENLEVLHLPQLGHLIAIPVDSNRNLESQKTLESLDFQFIAEDKLFYKNDKTRKLDEEIGDIRGIIFDMEASFIRELADCVLRRKHMLSAVSSIVAELDCILSLAQSAVTYNLCRPFFIEERTIRIRNGFHLLQHQTVDQFIPNDTVVGATDEECSILLLTGPNSSGKSVLLKQVGIIAYLAHCGSFVPAESVRLGPVDRIFCRMDFAETSTSSLSTFAMDCYQVSCMLNHSTPFSLYGVFRSKHSTITISYIAISLLVDEFGKGTCKEDGIALVTSLVHYFSMMPLSNCPRILSKGSP